MAKMNYAGNMMDNVGGFCQAEPFLLISRTERSSPKGKYRQVGLSDKSGKCSGLIYDENITLPEKDGIPVLVSGRIDSDGRVVVSSLTQLPESDAEKLHSQLVAGIDENTKKIYLKSASTMVESLKGTPYFLLVDGIYTPVFVRQLAMLPYNANISYAGSALIAATTFASLCSMNQMVLASARYLDYNPVPDKALLTAASLLSVAAIPLTYEKGCFSLKKTKKALQGGRFALLWDRICSQAVKAYADEQVRGDVKEALMSVLSPSLDKTTLPTTIEALIFKNTVDLFEAAELHKIVAGKYITKGHSGTVKYDKETQIFVSLP